MLNQFAARAASDDPYSEVIERFVATEFPSSTLSSSNLLDTLTNCFIATNNVRLGPIPNPERLVAIREVLRSCISFSQPIPILIPWGGRKTVASATIDVAEVCALKQLACLQHRVQSHFAPGLRIVIRLEDAGAEWLYRDEPIAPVMQYCADFTSLTHVLGVSAFVQPLRESKLMKSEEYMALAAKIAAPMLDFITATDKSGFGLSFQSLDSWKALSSFGWQNPIPQEQREHYRSRYRAMYPGISDADSTSKLADYLAGALARVRLNGTGLTGPYIKLSFVPPVPGEPSNLALRTIYYRTIPSSFTRDHIAAWRARGYLLYSGASMIPKVASWRAPLRLNPHTTTLTSRNDRVVVRTDYAISNHP